MNEINNFIFNNSIIKDNQLFSVLHNRSFKYGDALFESIHAYGTEPQFLDFHLERLYSGMKLLKMEIPPELSSNNIQHLITKILNKNRIFGGARIRLTVFRQSEGLYTPESNKVGFLLVSEPLQKDKYELNKNGLMTDIYPDIKKPINILSNLKTASSLLYIMAALYKKENGLDDCILLNEKDRITESTSSNIFLVKKFKIFTPALSEGCLNGVMRKVVSGILKESGYVVNDNCSLTINDMELADEIFFTNAIEGVKWVVAFRDRRYYNKTSKNLVNKLNELSFPG